MIFPFPSLFLCPISVEITLFFRFPPWKKVDFRLPQNRNPPVLLPALPAWIPCIEISPDKNYHQFIYIMWSCDEAFINFCFECQNDPTYHSYTFYHILLDVKSALWSLLTLLLKSSIVCPKNFTRTLLLIVQIV